MVVTSFLFTFDAYVTLEQARMAMDSLPPGDGISAHGDPMILGDGHIVRVEVHLDSITQKQMAQTRVRDALFKAIAEQPHAYDPSADSGGSVLGDTIKGTAADLGAGVNGIAQTVGDAVGGLTKPLAQNLQGLGFALALGLAAFALIFFMVKRGA